MTLAGEISIALATTTFLLVLCVGLEATLRDATHLFRHHGGEVRLMPPLAYRWH
jgi:hypothetical protein